MLPIGENIELDGNRIKVFEWFSGTGNKHTQLFIGINHKGEKVVLKAQRRHKDTVYQVTTEQKALTDIWRQKIPELRIQKPLGYGCYNNTLSRVESYVLVTKMEGPDLNTLASSDGTHTPRHVLVIAEQVLGLIKKVHSVDWLHRDLKPENIVVGLDDSGQLFLIDFGTAQHRLDRHGRIKTEPQDVEGTYPYMSVWVLKKQPMGKRDDIESLLWTLLKLSLGRLPWDGDKPTAMLNKKLAFKSPENLDVSMTAFFEGFVQHVRALVKFDDEPDYALLQDLVQTAWKRLGYPGKVRDACLEY